MEASDSSNLPEETGDVTPPPTGAPSRPLTRSRADRMVAGVCGGLAKYLGLDSVWVRLAFVVLTIVSGGAALLAYVVAWIVIPEGDGAGAPAEAGPGGSIVIGALLVVVGVGALVDRLVPWLDRVFWPVVIISLGVALIMWGRHRDAGT